jgi:uncharacterized protein (TIGR03437 family)
MTRRNIIVAAQATTLLAVIPVMMWGNLAGPPAGYSGANGEQNCAECHTSNNGGGSVTIAFPNGLFYTPGTSQNWTLTIADEAGMSWGFQLTTRQAGTTTQEGSYQPGNDDYTQVLCANGYDPTATSPAIKQAFITVPGGTPCMTGYSYQWIEQTWDPSNPIGNPQNGARVGYPSPQSFTFGWNPPSTNVGNIDVWVAAVAGNGTDATSGGNVYINHYVLSVPTSTQPAIAAGGVVNGASYQPTIGPNTWVTIQGTNLANTTATASWNKNEPLATTLDGVSVTIGGTPTYVDYISPTQVNVLTPPTLVAGSNLNVQLVNNTVDSYPGTVTAQAEAPAMFEWKSKYAVATFTDFSYVGPTGLFPNITTTPAKAGDTIILWATGLGTTNPPLPDGNLTPSLGGPYKTIHTPQVSIGGIGAQLVGAALAPGYAGLYQVAFVVPNGLSNGDQPIVITSDSLSSPSGVYLTIGN